METKVTESKERDLVEHTCPKCKLVWKVCMLFTKVGWFYTNGLGKALCPRCGNKGKMI